jgi:hypothetical protein
MLIAAGVDLEARTRSNRSVVAMALYSGNVEFARWIREEQTAREHAKRSNVAVLFACQS